MTSLIVENQILPTRVDKYLSGKFPELSRSIISLQCKKKLVSLKSGKILAAGDVLKGGEELCLSFDTQPLQASGLKVSGDLPIKIIFEDEHLVVLEKPSGMPSVTLTSEDPVTVADSLLKFDPSFVDVSEDKREAGLIHRLDTASSGLMIAARSTFVWQLLREELKAGRIKKSYSCLVQGETLYSNYSLYLQLGAKGKKVKVSENEFVESSETFSKISTKCSGVFAGKKLSIVSVDAPFAKRHQVRAHLSHLEHPLVGDTLYGASYGLKEVFKDSSQEFILHANSLSFTHPIERKELAISSKNDLLEEVFTSIKK